MTTKTRVSIGTVILAALACLLLIGTPMTGEAAEPTMEPAGVPGLRVMVGGGEIPAELWWLLRRWLSDQPADQPFLIVPTAADNPDQAAQRCKEQMREAGIDPERLQVIRDDADAASEQIDQACGLWFCGGQQSRLAEAWLGTPREAALDRMAARESLIGGTSAGAAVMSRVMVASGQSEPRITTGFELVPGVIVDQHFSERHREERLRRAISQHPTRIGLGIDESTALVLAGRRLSVLGKGSVTVTMARSDAEAIDQSMLQSGESADLTQLRRAADARARKLDPGSPRDLRLRVPDGALVIVGGGGVPESVAQRFIDLAGGRDARIVVLPTALPRRQALTARAPQFLRRADIADLQVLTASRPDEIEFATFRDALANATGVWFNGGRQWRFVDAYEGTPAIEGFRQVLQRGGVIGGSSAGATIQGDLLVRGHPLGNTIMMAEGYERGFAFLPGSSIDQHFSQRGRLPDLVPVVQRYPQMLGIGIDESTALIVQGSRFEVIGDGDVYFLDADWIDPHVAEESNPSQWQQTVTQAYHRVPAGQQGRFDAAPFDAGAVELREDLSSEESDSNE